MREFVVMVGLSGSGKSYQAFNLAEYFHMSSPKYDGWGRADVVEIISSDSIREEILGDVNDQTQNDLVFKEVHNRIRRALLNHYHVIVDATNINITILFLIFHPQIRQKPNLIRLQESKKLFLNYASQHIH